MAEDGETKDDVKVPDGEVGDKINKLFTEEEKDTSECLDCTANFSYANSSRRHCPHFHGRASCYRGQGGSKRCLNEVALAHASAQSTKLLTTHTYVCDAGMFYICHSYDHCTYQHHYASWLTRSRDSHLDTASTGYTSRLGDTLHPYCRDGYFISEAASCKHCPEAALRGVENISQSVKHDFATKL